jgi:hypothetical protein
VLAVIGLGLQHCHGRVGEHGMVSPGREQLGLSSGHCLGVEAFDAAHDQPGLDVLAFAARGERGERYFGDLGVRYPAAQLVVPYLELRC